MTEKICMRCNIRKQQNQMFVYIPKPENIYTCMKCWEEFNYYFDPIRTKHIFSFFQPERSKREDSVCIQCAVVFYTETLGTEMRCSELHGNMERDK